MDKKDKDELISYISSLKKNSFTDHLIEYISSNGSIRPGVSVKSRSGRKGIVKDIYYDTNVTVKWGLSTQDSHIKTKDIVVIEDDCDQLVKPEYGDTLFSFSGVHGIYEFHQYQYISDVSDYSTSFTSYAKCFIVKNEDGLKYIYESDIVKVVKN